MKKRWKKILSVSPLKIAALVILIMGFAFPRSRPWPASGSVLR